MPEEITIKKETIDKIVDFVKDNLNEIIGLIGCFCIFHLAVDNAKKEVSK